METLCARNVGVTTCAKRLVQLSLEPPWCGGGKSSLFVGGSTEYGLCGGKSDSSAFPVTVEPPHNLS